VTLTPYYAASPYRSCFERLANDDKCASKEKCAKDIKMGQSAVSVKKRWACLRFNGVPVARHGVFGFRAWVVSLVGLEVQSTPQKS
jgi:hypothetical protein